MAADQPVESDLFPGILEGLLGRIGIAAPGVRNPPTSSQEGAAQLWATAVQDAVQETEKRWVRLKSPESSSLPPRLHLNYEEGFLNRRSQQVPGVFTDPLFLPNMVNSVCGMAKTFNIPQASTLLSSGGLYLQGWVAALVQQGRHHQAPIRFGIPLR